MHCIFLRFAGEMKKARCGQRAFTFSNSIISGSGVILCQYLFERGIFDWFHSRFGPDGSETAVGIFAGEHVVHTGHRRWRSEISVPCHPVNILVDIRTASSSTTRPHSACGTRPSRSVSTSFLNSDRVDFDAINSIALKKPTEVLGICVEIVFAHGATEERVPAYIQPGGLHGEEK